MSIGALLLALGLLPLTAIAAQADPIITPILISAFALTPTVAGIVSSVIVIVVGFGLQMLAATLFKPSQPRPSDGQVVIKQAAAPRTRSYGRVKVAGVLMFANTTQGAYGRVIAMGSGEIDAVEEHWIDDTLVTLDGVTVTTPKYQKGGGSKAFIDYRLGTDSPAPYGALVSTYPDLWTDEHLGKGIPSAFVVLHQVKSEDMGDMFPQYGNTNYRQVQRAAKVPNLSAGVLTAPDWSDNAARIIIDYLTHPDGLKLDSTWITNAASDWQIAIDTCNEVVGGELRYKIGNTYRFDERPADVLGRFLQACDATIYPTPDRGIAIKVGKWIEPTVTIDDDAIIGFSEFGRGRDILTTANTIRARYTSPDHDYLETDADPWVDDADVDARGEFSTDLNFFAVPTHSQCRRLMKIAAARSNPAWVGTLTCNLRALPVMGERYIWVTISELGISETFEVLNVQLLIAEGSILNGVRVQVASLSAAAYDWSETTARVLTDEGTPPSIPPPIVPERDIPMPTGAAVTALTSSGHVVAVSWDAPPEDYLLVDVRYKPIALPEWLAAPVAPGELAVHLGPLAYDTAYEIQLRHRSDTSTRVSAWSSSIAHVVGAEPPAPDVDELIDGGNF